MSVFLCVVLSCVGRGLGAGLIPAKESYQMSKGSISKKEKSDALKRHKEKRGRRRRRVGWPFLCPGATSKTPGFTTKK
jgi:hypothetical protein